MRPLNIYPALYFHPVLEIMQKNDADVVVVLGTGGTIAGLAVSPQERHSYRAAQLGVSELVAAAQVTAAVKVESEQVAQLDSKDMDFATWRALALRVAHHVARDDVAGVVITHGTDTLEETAYFLARVVAVTKPVVLTAAMRPASSLEADGPRNLGDAIALAAQGAFPGVVVVVAGQVHAARDVRKVHPHRLDAFSSGEAGPLAHIVIGRMQTLREGPTGEADPVGIDLLPSDASAWPWVEIVTSVAGSDGRAANALVDAGVEGIVVAGTGNGTIHHRLAAALQRAGQAGVALMRSTRCLDGAIVATSGDLLPSGGDLTPMKARVELILALLVARSRA
jgi:L-asparaginase